MSTNQTNNEEEVDLGSLFIIIGKGFSNFFNFIGNVFKGIFHLIILFLLFIRKSAIKIIIVGFSFGLIGFFLDYNKEVVFESKMLVQPNFNSAKQLYSNISFYNDLVLQKENSLIASIFNITDKEAESLRSFYIEPIINGNDIINGYDKLALSVDTLAIKDYSIKEYRNTFTDFDYSVHEIKIKATENKIFIKLDSTILNSISNNTFFKNVSFVNNSVISTYLIYNHFTSKKEQFACHLFIPTK